MKKLVVNIDNLGNTGMANIIMGIEVALGIAFLCKRTHITFVSNYKIHNSQNGLNIFDLYDLRFPHEVVESYDTSNSSILCYEQESLSNVVFYHKEYPNTDFINDRQKVFDLSLLEEESVIFLYPKRTLAFYSYLFFLTGSKRDSFVEFIKSRISPKEKYFNIAKNIVDTIILRHQKFTSVCIRRTDFLRVYTDSKSLEISDFKKVLKSGNSLMIHSDEFDLSFLKDVGLLNYESVESFIIQYFNDKSEIGLVSLIIASFSDDFFGTMRSTYTSLVQRNRMYNGKKEEFKYIKSDISDIKINDSGTIKETSFGRYSWNRIEGIQESKPILYWIKENRECYFNKHNLSYSIRTFNNFLVDYEVEYIKMLINRADTEKTDHLKRDRLVVPLNSNSILRNIRQKTCETLGYDESKIEENLQIFKQKEGGETFYHEDSLYEDYKGKRISTVLFYLNDDFEGSDIHFPNAGLTIKPSIGLMIAYPLINKYSEHDKTYGHFTTLISKGEKVMCLFSLKEK